jgi:hypothetical protein
LASRLITVELISVTIELTLDGNEVFVMKRLNLIVTGALLAVVTLVLALFLTITTMSEMPPVQADVSNQFTVPAAQEEVHYAQLTDARPQRDISQQQFAPLE